MKVAISAPIPLLEEYCAFTSYHLCKPSLVLHSRKYLDFYKGRKALGDLVILDSSDTLPRENVAPSVLFELALTLEPTLVVAPDWDMNSVKTAQQTDSFLKTYKERLRASKIGILGMVQGATMEQCLTCYRSFYKLVDAIGLPRSVEAAVGRVKFLKRIRTKKPIHIFDIQSNPEEELDSLLDLGRGNIVGVSSDLPIRLGLACRLLDELRPEPPLLDFYSNYNPFPDFTRKNIEDFLALAEGV